MELINLSKLQHEYETTYINHWNKDNPLLDFKQWLKKEKGIIFIKKN